MRGSVKMARLAEKAAWNRLVAAQKNPNTYPDEFRKVNATFIHAQANRARVEQGFRDWQRAQGITLFLDEALEIAARPHRAIAHMLASGPKQLAPRLVNQPLAEIERSLADWADGISAELRRAMQIELAG